VIPTAWAQRKEFERPARHAIRGYARKPSQPEAFLTGKDKASELYGGPGLTPELPKEYDAYIKKRTEELKNGTKN
jgi:hypothetical protein